MEEKKIEQLRLWWKLFRDECELSEIRILGNNRTYSGYFKNFENIVSSIENYDRIDNMQIYFVLNNIKEECYSRTQQEKIIEKPKETTSDNDVLRRKFLLIDLDPKRASGVGSSNEEMEYAHMKAIDIYRFLLSKGIKEPIIAKSGNGFHIILRIDMNNDKDSLEIVTRFLKAMNMLFGDEKIDIDTKVGNAARICKLYGTTAKKGTNSEDRPWRMSEIVKYPNVLEINDTNIIKSIGDSIIPVDKCAETKDKYQYGENKFDLEEFLAKHGVQYSKMPFSGGTKYVLSRCVFNENHKGKDAAIFKADNGALSYYCFHNSCSNYKWRDVRIKFEPNAYDNDMEYRPLNFGMRNFPKKPKYEIKNELPELGKKWMSMSDIKKVDLSELEYIPTGFNNLDNSIIGLYLGETTILSGSNSSGKSSWINSLICNAVDKGYKAALWSGELRPDILKTWIQMVAAGKRYLKPSKFDKKYYVPTLVAEKIDSWMDGKFFLYNNEYSQKWEQIFNDMKELLKVGVNLFILDNLFSLDIDIFDGDKNNKQKELILQICSFAKSNNVHIMLVAHPRKVTSFLRKNDISGTGDLANAVDNIFIVHRVNNDFLKSAEEFFGKNKLGDISFYGNIIEVAKNRLYGAVDVMCGMYYEQESRRFTNYMEDSKEYGWLEEFTQSNIEYFEEPHRDIKNNENFYQQEQKNDEYFELDDKFGMPY